MIYGYIIATASGILLRYRFFGKFMETKENDVSLLASGLTALLSFFNMVSDDHLETVAGEKYRIFIASRGELIFAVLSDKLDVMAKSVANKYVSLLIERIRELGIDLSVFIEGVINKAFGDIFARLDEEIEELNKQAGDVKYIL